MNGIGLTKAEIVQALAESTGLHRKVITNLLDELTAIIRQDLGKKGPGIFTLPGLLKLKRVEKPATKARTGRNPRNGEPMTIKARPARNVVRLRVVKDLKDMVK
jgi:nucleoid DNA-binding protein